MSPFEKRQRQKKRKSLFRKWHRRIGFVVCILLVNLAVTGILLNHYQALSLHQSWVSSPWLLDWYGIKAPDSAHCLQSPLQPNASIACQMGDTIYLQTQGLSTPINLVLQTQAEIEPPLEAIYQVNDVIYLLTATELFLLTDAGELIESLSYDSLNITSPEQSSISESGQLWILHGQEWLRLNEDSMTFSPMMSEIAMHRSQPYKASPALLSIMQTDYLNHRITHLKLVQDIHSGVFFFGNGKLLTDLAALGILLLVISGIVTWQRRLGRENQSS